MFKYLLYFMYTGVLPSQNHCVVADGMNSGENNAGKESKNKDDGCGGGGGDNRSSGKGRNGGVSDGRNFSWGGGDQGVRLDDSSIRNLKSFESLDANEVSKLQALASKYEVKDLIKMLVFYV